VDENMRVPGAAGEAVSRDTEEPLIFPIGNLTGDLKAIADSHLAASMRFPKFARACASCAFSVKEDADLVCRRHPPAVTMTAIPVIRPSPIRGGPPQQGMELKSFTQFPVMRDDQWCGEFE
jgi:hypothetical protein